jgi:hypothetical protein
MRSLTIILAGSAPEGENMISYGQALKFGWAIGWRVACGLPFIWTQPLKIPLWLCFMLASLLFLPNAIQGAVRSSYSDFSVRVVRPTERAAALSYFEALQASVPTIIIYLGLGPLHLRWSFWLLAFIASHVFVVFPAIAAAVVHLPFWGFRIVVARGSCSLRPGDQAGDLPSLPAN